MYPILSKSYLRKDDVLVVGCYFKFYYCFRRPTDIARNKLAFIRYCLYARLYGVHDRSPEVTNSKHSYSLQIYETRELNTLTKEQLFNFFYLLLYDYCLLGCTKFSFVSLGVVYDASVFDMYLDRFTDLRTEVGFDNIVFFKGHILAGCFGAELVRGRVRHRITKRDGIFVLLKGTEGRGLEEKFFRVGVLGGGVEVWRITTMALWGTDHETVHGFEEGRVLGDMFRVKQWGEVKRSATAGVRFHFNRTEEGGTFGPVGEGDNLVFSIRRGDLDIFWEEVGRVFRSAGLVLPSEILDDLGIYFFDRMCFEQRVCFLDVLNLLKAWAAETERMGREREGWGVGEKRFLFCFFVQTLSFERFMEIFIYSVGIYRLEVTSLFFDILGFCFWANLEGSDMELWGEVLETEEGYRFFRRGGLGQFFDWGDGEWGRRRRRGDNSVAYCVFAERKLTLPPIFVEANRM